jgi:hypothetical protein
MATPSRNISGRCAIEYVAMPPTKKQRVVDLAAARVWGLIGEAEWGALRAALSDVSEATIRASGVPIAPPWCGVRQHTLDDLETSLRELSAVYAARPDLRRYCREQVIAAKARARVVSRRENVDEGKRHLKSEMVEWMLVWLGDPAIFPEWAAMRRERIR